MTSIYLLVTNPAVIGSIAVVRGGIHYGLLYIILIYKVIPLFLSDYDISWLLKYGLIRKDKSGCSALLTRTVANTQRQIGMFTFVNKNSSKYAKANRNVQLC